MAENNPFDNVRPPFSAYDFFAHLIPGLTFFACLYIFEVGIDKNDLIQDAFFSNYNIRWLITETRPAPDVNFLRNAGFLLISILFVYAISHVIASISSFFIDRLLIYKGFGYPYRFLVLGESYKKLPVGKQIRRKYYQGIFFWGNFCLLAI